METEERFQRRGSNRATAVLDCSKASLNSREAFEFPIPFCTHFFPRFFEYGRPVEPG